MCKEGVVAEEAKSSKGSQVFCNGIVGRTVLEYLRTDKTLPISGQRVQKYKLIQKSF